MKFIVDSNTHALLAITHTERSAKLNLVADIVFSNEILKLFNDLTGSFNVAGATDTNSNFHKNCFLSVLC
jgi:hypothetical protein